MEYARLVWHELTFGDAGLMEVDEQVQRTPGALLIGAEGVFDAVSRSESGALSMVDKRSAVDGTGVERISRHGQGAA